MPFWIIISKRWDDMKSKRLLNKFIVAVFIALCSFLFVQNYSFAEDSVSTEPQTIQNENQIQNNPEINAEKNNSINKSNTNKPTPLATFTIPKTNVKPAEKETKVSPKPAPSSRYTITFRGRTFDFKKHLHLTTLIAIVGLAGTFFGLFSTWLIYHLNKRHNNPLKMDKHHSAIKYLDELNRIRVYFENSDIKNLYKNADVEGLQRLIYAYEELVKNISKIDLITIHTRYQKHIKKRRLEVFEALIASYKMIKIDGDFLNNNEDSHIFDSKTSSTDFIKSKVLLVLSFEEQIEVILKILRKELKL